MEEGTVLSDSLMSIATWAANNPGKGVDAMLRELAPVPDPEKATEEEVAQATEKQQNLVRDLFWLSEQGYILVFSNNTVSRPKAVPAQAPSPKRLPRRSRNRKRRIRTCRWRKPPRPQEQKEDTPSSEAPAAREEPAEETDTAAEPAEAAAPPVEEELPAENVPETVGRKSLTPFPEFPRHTVRRIILILRTLFCRRKGNQQDFTYDQYNNGNRS